MNVENLDVENLIRNLEEMVFILSMDRHCRWHKVFSKFLNDAGAALSSLSPEREIQNTCLSIINAYTGVKSFSEYTPVEYNHEAGCFNMVPGMENFFPVSEKLFTSAIKLRPAAEYKPGMFPGEIIREGNCSY